jgi:hypothetical protein
MDAKQSAKTAAKPSKEARSKTPIVVEPRSSRSKDVKVESVTAGKLETVKPESKP